MQHKNDIHTNHDRTAEIIGQVLVCLAAALFLLGTVWVIRQAVRCIENILFAVMFFAAVALGG